MHKKINNDQNVQIIKNELKEKFSDIVEALGDWPGTKNHGVFYNQPKSELATPYLRDEFIINACRGKRVLHFGFADSPFTEERVKSKELLHLKLANVASLIYGADIDSDSVSKYTSLTNDNKHWIIDICKKEIVANDYNKRFDIVVFGEILEHLLNPGDALKNLNSICHINKAQLILTTPNAFNGAGFSASLLGNEIVHPEHYYYYSPVTLKRLLEDCGFTKVKISFYSGENSKQFPGLTYPGLIAICSAGKG